MLYRPPLARTATAASSVAERPTRHFSAILLRRRPMVGTRPSYGRLSSIICSRRQIHLPNILLPPVIFTGLLLALYTWKSFIMVSLQNKIIYNPYLPPTARHERISDWKKYLCGIEWKELHMRSIDRTDLALAVASVSSAPDDSENNHIAHHVYILYCQGLYSIGQISRRRMRELIPGPQGMPRRFHPDYQTIHGS